MTPIPPILDFDLEISPGQGRDYPLKVNSSAGEARQVMHFPFDQIALESRLKDLQIALLRSGGRRRQALSLEEQAVRDFGGQLFDAILTGDARARYEVARNQAAQHGQTLRLRLRITPPELACLPWEFLFDPGRGEYLCLAAETPLVRYIEQPQIIPSLTITPPLRILGMVAAPTDLPELDITNEKARVEKALAALTARGQVTLEWLPGAAWRDLQAAMRKGPWHVFHFIGHGSFDANKDEGLLAFCDDSGASHFLTASKVGLLLEGHKSLRLALLNACESATGSKRDIFSSTAAILVRRGLPAVLAMQYEITDAAAVEFSRTFYESLADGCPVDIAVTEARKAISIAVANSLEWGTPVLYLRASDGQLFDWASLPSIPTVLAEASTPNPTGVEASAGSPANPALAMAQRALALLEEQAAGYTSLTLPAHLQIQLEDKRKEVRALVERTSRSPRTVSSPLLPASPQGRTNSSPYITLELTAAPNPAPAGTPVTWTVVARNTGSAAAHHLALLRGTAMLGDEFNLPAGEACTFNFTQTYEKSGEYAESVRLFGAPQPCTASAILAVFAPPDFALSVTPSSLEARSDQQIEFTVNLRNTGDVDLNRVLLRLGRQVFEDPFDLPVGGEHSLVFTRTYTSDTIAYITAAAITPAGERLEREASAIVKVIAPQKPDRSPSLPEPTQAVARENPSAGQRNREDLSGLRSITLAPGVEMEFVRIPAGEFIMGSDKQKDPQASDDETPQHKIRLDEYWIGKTPVTNAQYAVFAKATNQKFALPKGKENHPVVNVSWNDAAVFCQWLSKLSGQQVRLPSEAEWEKAARGTNGRIYPWGDEWDAKKCNSRDSGIRNTTPVGKFSPAGDSPYGCVDMAGNVWEWVADWYDGHYSAISSVSSPVGPQSGNSRVMRGGAWDGDVAYIRSASRYYLTPTNRYDLLGFRCVAASP